MPAIDRVFENQLTLTGLLSFRLNGFEFLCASSILSVRFEDHHSVVFLLIFLCSTLHCITEFSRGEKEKKKRISAMWPMSHALYPGLNNPERRGSVESRKTWYGNHRQSNIYADSQRSYNRYSRYSYAAPSLAESNGEPLSDLIQRSQDMLGVLNVAADKDRETESRQFGDSSTLRPTSSRYSEDDKRWSSWSQWTGPGDMANPRWSRPPTAMTSREEDDDIAPHEQAHSREPSFGSSTVNTAVGPYQTHHEGPSLAALSEHGSEEVSIRSSTPTPATFNAGHSASSSVHVPTGHSSFTPEEVHGVDSARKSELSLFNFGNITGLKNRSSADTLPVPQRVNAAGFPKAYSIDQPLDESIESQRPPSMPAGTGPIDLSDLPSPAMMPIIPQQSNDIMVYHMKHDQPKVSLSDIQNQPLPWVPGQPLETLRERHQTTGNMTISGLTMVGHESVQGLSFGNGSRSQASSIGLAKSTNNNNNPFSPSIMNPDAIHPFPSPPPHAMTTTAGQPGGIPSMVNLKGEPLVDFIDSSPSSPALSPPAPTYNPDSKANNNDDLHLITSQPCGPDRDPASLPPKILLPLPSLILTTLALSVSVFLVAMDVNVIATAIPHITTEFRSLNDIGWYGSAFLLTTCACQVPYGRVYTLFPAKWTFLSAIFLFMAGSLICALAPSSGIFILGRGVQGVGTSGILSGGLIIIAQVVPLHLRSILTGIIGAMEGIAMISAPVIGGALTDHLNWRWCFWVNLPIGGVVVLVVLFCLRMPEGEEGWKSAREEGETIWQTLRKLDLVGALALLPPVVCTILALHYAGNGYSWSSMNVILLFVLALVLFVIFGWTQHVNADVAMMPWRVVKQRSVMAAFWFILCISSALVVITYFLPLWFQTVRGEVATQAGIGILPMLVGVILGVLISGALVALIGYYTPFMLLSSALMPVGVGLLTTINPETSRGALIAYPAIFGLGVGLGFQQPLIGVQAVVAKADIPIGTSIVVFGQTFGAAIIIAVGESIFSNRLAANVVTYLGVTDIDMRHVLGDGQAGSSLASQLSPEQMPLLIRAVNDSLTQTFYLSVVMGILSLVGAGFMEWKNVKPPKAEKVATAEAGGVGAGEMREKF